MTFDAAVMRMQGSDYRDIRDIHPQYLQLKDGEFANSSQTE